MTNTLSLTDLLGRQLRRLVFFATAAVLVMWDHGAHRPTLYAQGGCLSNPVACENQLAGTTDSWDVAVTDPTIVGFAANLSVNVGQDVDFKIKTDSINFQIDVYRLGYYAGAGARKLASLGPFTNPQNQSVVCATDAATGLIDCGNWAVTASWNTAGAPSGVYVAKLTRNDTGGASHIIFIVRDDTRTADIVFQTSDTTWQAYNRWPGASATNGSLYCGGPISNAGTEYAVSCATRSVKVSYNRPFDTRIHDPQSFVFNAEYPMIRWLEANGYDVKYTSGVDTDRLGAQLIGAHKPKTFLSVGHDEYWSAGQRTSVVNARNAGVNLAFLSGNEMFWKTRYEASIDSASTPYKTLVSYKETLRNATNNDPADPLDSGLSPIWTGTWRDPSSPNSDGGRPENAVTGQLWTINCCADQIRVPDSMKSARFWRNTRVATLAPGTSTVLPPESLGYEWDEAVDNGVQPAGLVRLSSTTVNAPEKVLDFGATFGPGTATHSLTVYRHNSGALVFGAGTVQWSWGLDGTHDRGGVGAHSPDPAMQQATINLFADMGNVQPATLQASGDPTQPLSAATASQDIFAPTSAITSPSAGAAVQSGAHVSINGTATDQGGGSVAAVEVSVDGGTTWHPAVGTSVWSYDWSPGALGAATIKSRAIDDSGNMELAGAGVSVVVTAGNCPCASLWPPTTVPAIQDFSDSAAYELGVKFKSDIDGFITGIRYYKSLNNTGTHLGNLWSASGALLAAATFTGETASGWQQVLFATPVAITANTTYVASYHTNVGHYAVTSGYFTSSGVDSPPLHAQATGVVGGNGVFSPGTSAFPSTTFGGNNYWVDVVFAASTLDVTPPVISSVRETTIDSSKVVISWTTNEAATSRVDYSTIVSLPDAATVHVSDSNFATTHSITLTGLVPYTTYFYRVVSVDRAGNEGRADAPSFTLPGPTLRDTAQSDFQAGSGTNVYAAQTADGELTLAPTAGSEFSGSALPSGWIEVPWGSNGYSAMGGGVLLVDGARVATCAIDITTGGCQSETTTSTPSATYTPGHSLEFVATFTGDAFQHSGFAVTLGQATEPWAIFSTLSGGSLYARTNTGSASDDHFLGSAFVGGPHRFRIDWLADGTVNYFIDGAPVWQSPLLIAGNMRPVAASDFNEFGGNVAIDWMRVTPYAASGTFLSRVFDAQSAVDWRAIQWTLAVPAQTSLGIQIRTGDTPTPDQTWTAFAPIAAPGPLNLHSRYIQYQAALTSTDPNATPELRDIIISTDRAPIANADSVAVPENSIYTFPASGPGSLVFNDTDPDNDPLRVVAVSGASHGSLVLNADGSVTYTPTANYSGPDAFVYTVSDGLLVASAGVSIDVRFGNVPPVANNDLYGNTTAPTSLSQAECLAANAQPCEDTLFTVPAPGVLANDFDVEHDTLHAVLVSPPMHGTLTFGSNGAFSYMPVANYSGEDSFTYRANDGSSDGNVATVTLLIHEVNDPPITRDDTYTNLLNQVLHVAAPGVLANDRDVEVEDTAPLRAQLATAPANGTVTLNSDGSFDYVPNADFLGADSFTYSAVDHFGAVGSPATVSITVAIKAVRTDAGSGGVVSTGSGDVTAADPLQSAVITPTAATVSIAQGVIAASNAPSGYTFLNQQINITIQAPDGTEIAASAANPIKLIFTLSTSLMLPGQTVSAVQLFRNGVLIPACPGQTSIPAANLDPCVTARELTSNGNPRITIISTHASRWNMGVSTVTPDEAPVAQDDGSGYQVDFETPVLVQAPGVLGNDYGGGALTATLVPGSVENGTVDLKPSGAFLFTPGAGACGRGKFRYKASDGARFSNEAVVDLLIDCRPHAFDDALTVDEDSGTTTITVLANDTDPDPGQTLTVTDVTAPAHGVASIFNGTRPGSAVNYAPNADYFGSDSYTYTISDGRGGTATATVNVTVRPVNDTPSFVKGANQTVLEDAGPQTVAGWASGISAGPANESSQVVDFLVTSDNPALFAAGPAVASNGTLTYTTASNANGSAVVTVRAHDNGGVDNGGVDTSAPQTFTINVTAVNDAPSFTKGADQTVGEDAGPQTIIGWASAIAAGPADEAGQVLTFQVTANSNPSLFSAAPSVSANGTLAYTPAPDAHGSATITIVLKDNGGTANGGSDTSAGQSFVITVSDINDAPSFTKGADQAVLEDAGAHTVVAWATGISAGPLNESSQLLDFLVTSDNAALFAAGPAVSSSGTLTYTPAPNANGVAHVTVRVHDNGGTANGGVDTSGPQTFTISVTAVNDAPSFTKGADETVVENSGAQTFVGWATNVIAGPSDEAGQALNFLVSNNNGALFSAQPAIAPNGTLTFTSAPNANGSALVTVSLHDNGGVDNGGADTSAAQTFTITVTPVNNAPSFTKGADQSVLENAGMQTVAAWATTISAGPPDEAGQTLTFQVIGNTNPALFSAVPAISAGGTLTYTPSPNNYGTANVTVVLQDNGGIVNGGVDTSAPQTFTITVIHVNQAPSFTKGGAQTVLEDAGAQSIGGWATGISAGPNESDQTVDFAVSNSNNALFSVQPAISPAGTLSFTPAPNTSGSATVTVRIHDNGGTANGGVDISAAQTFAISVTAINDAPTFTKGPDQVEYGNPANHVVPNWSTNMSAGPADEAGQTLAFTVTNDNPALFLQQPAVDSAGTLTWRANNSVKGAAVVTVTLKDSGGTANGGHDSSSQTFTITLLKAGTKTAAAIKLISSTASSSSSLFGEPVTFTVAVTAVEPGAGIPSGTIVFMDGVSTMGSGALDATGQTTFTTGTLTGGTHTISAVFLETFAFFGSTSLSVTQTVMPPPTISIADVSVGAGSSGTVTAPVTVSLSGPAGTPITVSYGTANGTAVAGTDYKTADYNAASGTLTFAPGTTIQTIPITVLQNVPDEPNETFTVTLSNPTVGTIARATATVTIVDNASWSTTTSTVADFQSGTVATGAYVSQTSDGELILAPTVGAEFFGAALPAGWTSTPTQSGGSSTVANGVVTVDGASLLAPGSYAAGRSLEFVATFTGQPNQNAGFGLTSALVPPYAMFGTNTDGLFYARSVAPGSAQLTQIVGFMYNLPHRFRIDWNATNVVYSIDGVPLVTHTITYSGKVGSSMKPAALDATVGGGALKVDWMRMTAYAASGTYTSQAFNAGGIAVYWNLSWTMDAPSGTGVTVSYSTSADGVTWTPFAAFPAGSTSGSVPTKAKYLKYQVQETTSNPAVTPSVSAVVVTYQ